MKPASITLEDFTRDAPFEPVESTDFLRGLEEGLGRAAVGTAAQEQEALMKVAATLGDMAFGYAEARAHMMATLQPLLKQLSETILPQIAHQTFGAHLVEAVTAAFDESVDEPVSISVMPGTAERLNDTFSGEQGVNFIFVEDPNLSSGQAVLRQGAHHRFLDLPSLTTALQAALDGLSTPERKVSHG